MSAGPLRQRADGVDLHVRLTPRAAIDKVDGIAETADGNTHLKARVRAVPENGKANTALQRLVSAWLDMPVRDITLVSGATSRLKTLRIAGDPPAIAAHIESCIARLAEP